MPGPSSLSDAKRAASDQAERAFLERGLQAVNGTVVELARRCEMNRSHLQMLLKKHGTQVEGLSQPDLIRERAADLTPVAGAQSAGLNRVLSPLSRSSARTTTAEMLSRPPRARARSISLPVAC